MAKVSPPRRSPPPIASRTIGGVNPVTFLQETVAELRKSVWPSREETARLTAVVIVLAVAIGFFLGGLDRLFSEVLTRFVF
jgi:preprotein translocase subunit SecE